MQAAYGSFRRLRDRVRARRDGRRDGLLGIPTREEVAHPPAQLQIAQRANEALAELARSWTSDAARLRERQGTQSLELRSAEDDIETAATSVAGAESRSQRSQTRSDDFAASSSVRGAGPRMSPRVYAVAIVAILVAEFPLNAIAFRLFGEAEVLTWVMTASLAVTLVLCAHGLGTFLRLEHPTMAERRWVIVLVALPVLTIVAIAVIRARYLSLEAAVTGLEVLGPVVGSLVFLVINLLVYTGATMLSYLAHAPRARGARTAADEARTAHDDLGTAQEHLKEATRRARCHQEQLAHAGVANEEALGVARARASALVAYHRGLMALYCAANLRSRGNPEMPAVLRELPPIEVPGVLEEPPPVEPVTSLGNGRASAAAVHEVAR